MKLIENYSRVKNYKLDFQLTSPNPVLLSSWNWRTKIEDFLVQWPIMHGYVTKITELMLYGRVGVSKNVTMNSRKRNGSGTSRSPQNSFHFMYHKQSWDVCKVFGSLDKSRAWRLHKKGTFGYAAAGSNAKIEWNRGSIKFHGEVKLWQAIFHMNENLWGSESPQAFADKFRAFHYAEHKHYSIHVLTLSIRNKMSNDAHNWIYLRLPILFCLLFSIIAIAFGICLMFSSPFQISDLNRYGNHAHSQ